MSITVADVMKLPSMRGAKVLGGKRGLSRIVSSISVLEYAQVNPVQTQLLKNIDFLGNELAITGFMNNPDDVELHWRQYSPVVGYRRGGPYTVLCGDSDEKG